jgi:hypothetical protein
MLTDASSFISRENGSRGGDLERGEQHPVLPAELRRAKTCAGRPGAS